MWLENALVTADPLNNEETWRPYGCDWHQPDATLHCLLTIMVMASLSGVTRGQRDLGAFAQGLTQLQLRTLGSYRKRDGSNLTNH